MRVLDAAEGRRVRCKRCEGKSGLWKCCAEVLYERETSGNVLSQTVNNGRHTVTVPLTLGVCEPSAWP